MGAQQARHRTSANEYQEMAQSSSPKRVISNASVSGLVTPPFSATWSRYFPSTREYPKPRTGHFFSVHDGLNVAIIGCGADEQVQTLNDFWVLNLSSFEWQQVYITGDAISPRTGCRSVILDDALYVFGGYSEPTFYNDVFKIDLHTKVCERLATTGDAPSPRNTPVVCGSGRRLFVWGGYDGGWPSDLFCLDLDTCVWSRHKQTVQGRTGTTYAVIKDKAYLYASQAAGGITVIDMETCVVSQVETTGSEPKEDVVSAGMAAVDHYLFLIGGKAPSGYTLIYTCDVYKMQWFVFYAQPDMVTVNSLDGRTDGDGNFLVPRLASMGLVYSKKLRRIVSLLGRPMVDPTPVHVFEVGKAYSVIHMQHDMEEMLRLDMPKIEKIL